jgi:hypothetical protein
MASRENAIKNNLNDRARKVGQFDELTTQDIDALIAFYDYSCLQCGEKPASSVDHVKPLSKGGTNTYDNLQLLCVNCNKQKQDEEIDYRNGKVFSSEDAELFVENKPHIKRHRAPGGGRKPLEITVAKRRLRAERVDDAQYMLDMLTTWAKSEDLDVDFRRDCANDVLDRVLGKPTTMQPESDDLQRKYLENVKRVIFGASNEPGSPDAMESPEPGFDAVYAAIRTSTGSPSAN